MSSDDKLNQFHDRRREIITNDGTRLSVIDAGGGPPIVILPAWSNAAIEYWRQIVDFSLDHRVIAIDMRGHGESEKTPHGYRVSRFAADLQCVIDTLSIANATLMGHSMGCSVIWSYLDLYGQQNLSKLIFVDQAATQLIQPQWSEEERLSFGARDTPEELFAFCARLAGPDGERQTREMFLGLFTPAFPQAEAETIVGEILKMPRQHAATLMLDHATRDWRGLISQIRMPSLVVGARESVFPVESQAWIAQQIPSARLEIFDADDGGSHFMCFENPGRFNTMVREFLSA